MHRSNKSWHVLLRNTLALLFICAAFQPSTSAAGIDKQQSAKTANATTFQSLVTQANAARDAQQLDKAVALFQKALALRPSWAEGWWSLGTIYYDTDRYASAANAFQHLVKLDSRQGTALAMLGLCEFELGQDASALRAIEASKDLGILQDVQLRQVVLFHEGILLQRAGRFQGAQSAFGSLCISGVRSRELIQRLGMTALRMRAEASDSKDSSEIIELTGRGACLAASKNYADARKEYETALERHPQFPYLQYAYGRMLLDAHEKDAAIHAFQLEIANQSSDVFARLQIAAAQYKVDSAAGLPYAQEAVRLTLSMPFAHYLLGLLQLDIGEDQKAVASLEIAQRAFPQEAKIYWSLATAYAHLGRKEEAAKARAEFTRVNAASKKVEDGGAQSETAAPTTLEVSDSMADAKP